MAGYYGWSMSNNAVDAYENGRKPLSKWTKRDILFCLEERLDREDVSLFFSRLKKLPKKILMETFLYESEWHHTSSFYNHTSFYTFDETVNINDELLFELEERAKKEREAGKCNESKKIEYAEINYVWWSGTKKHPVRHEERALCIIINNWAYRLDNNGVFNDGTKKKRSFVINKTQEKVFRGYAKQSQKVLKQLDIR